MIRRLLSWLGVMSAENREIYRGICQKYGGARPPKTGPAADNAPHHA